MALDAAGPVDDHFRGLLDVGGNRADSAAGPGRTRLAAAGTLLDRLLHDMKQPLNLVRMVAQEVRRDARRGRVELDTLSEEMAELMAQVDRLVAMLDQFRRFVAGSKGAARRRVAVDEVCRASGSRLVVLQGIFMGRLRQRRGSVTSVDAAKGIPTSVRPIREWRSTKMRNRLERHRIFMMLRKR